MSVSFAIIMPNYNETTKFEAAIRNVLNQTEVPDEFIIIDDGSTEPSFEVAEAMIRDVGYAKLLRNPENQGVLKTVNRAIVEAKSDYLYFGASNDLVHPTLVERFREIVKVTQPGVISASNKMLLANGETTCLRQDPWSTEVEAAGGQKYFSGEEFAKRLNKHFFQIPGHQSIISRAALVEMGGMFDAWWASDFFANYTAAFRHGIVITDAPMAWYIPDEQALFTVGTRDRKASSVMVQCVLGEWSSSKYGDIRSRVRDSGVMSFFSPYGILHCFSNAQYSQFLTIQMAMRSVKNYLVDLGRQFAPKAIKVFVRGILSK